MVSRRGLLAGFSGVGGRALSAAGKPPRILLRSSWQSVNIGDIGHTPGALTLLGKYFPEAEITLWPGKLGHGSRELLAKDYPPTEPGRPVPDSPATAARRRMGFCRCWPPGFGGGGLRWVAS